MLVLTRKQGESIQIGNEIKVTLLSSNGRTARIGVDCPREIKVLRSELVQEWAEREVQSLEAELGDNTAIPLTCSSCQEESTNPGIFVGDRWVCCQKCSDDLLADYDARR